MGKRCGGPDGTCLTGTIRPDRGLGEDLIGRYRVPETRNSHAWRAHLPAGAGQDDLDLLAAGSLPAAWRRLAEAGPDRPAAVGRRAGLEVAGRAGGGLGPGGRAAAPGRAGRRGPGAGQRGHLHRPRRGPRRRPARGPRGRAGQHRLPASARSAHIVGDARPRGGRASTTPERGGWARRAAGGDLLVAGPEVDLPDGDPPPPRRQRRPGRPGPALLHVGHHRRAQGRRAQPTATCWPAPRRCAWPGAGRPTTGWSWPCRCSTCTASASACTARCWPARRPCCCPRFDADAVLDAAARPAGDACSSACRPCTPGWPPRPGPPSWAGCGCACRGRRRCPPTCIERWPSAAGPAGARALRHDRDDHERLQPLRRRAAAGHGRAARCPGSSCASPAATGRDAGAGPERVRRLLGATRRRPPSAVRRRRLVPHRRPRRLRRRRLPPASWAGARS